MSILYRPNRRLRSYYRNKYQLRLYCTSSTFYSSIFQIPRGPCQMEFPPACEVRVNNMQLQANLKGLKKKPGTTPPPDLGRLVKMSPGAANRLDMIYVNSQQPVHGKVSWPHFSGWRKLIVIRNTTSPFCWLRSLVLMS